MSKSIKNYNYINSNSPGMCAKHARNQDEQFMISITLED